MVDSAARPVSPQNTPSGAAADTRVHPRYTAGISEVEGTGSFRRFCATGFLCRCWWRLPIVSTTHASPRPYGLDYSVSSGQACRLRSSLSDHLGVLPASALPAGLPHGPDPA